ncbi:MAG: hypothetical protein AAF298_10870 [Cyanobacteria bacterium P01_A01_bin.40]
MFIQDLEFIDRVKDLSDIHGGASADASYSSSAFGGIAFAAADALGTGLLTTASAGTKTGAGSSKFYEYSYGAAYGAASGASYVAVPGYIKTDIKSAYGSSISSDIG